MSKKRAVAVFCPEFLKRKATREPIPLSTHEAAWSGPWAVAAKGNEFVVHRVGDPTPVAITRFRETALLIAAALPAAGRGPLYWLTPERSTEDHMFGLTTILGEQGPTIVGRFERRHEELLGPLSNFEYLARSSTSMAYLIEAAPAEALAPAGRLITDRLARMDEKG